MFFYVIKWSFNIFVYSPLFLIFNSCFSPSVSFLFVIDGIEKKQMNLLGSLLATLLRSLLVVKE